MHIKKLQYKKAVPTSCQNDLRFGAVIICLGMRMDNGGDFPGLQQIADSALDAQFRIRTRTDILDSLFQTEVFKMGKARPAVHFIDFQTKQIALFSTGRVVDGK